MKKSTPCKKSLGLFGLNQSLCTVLAQTMEEMLTPQANIIIAEIDKSLHLYTKTGQDVVKTFRDKIEALRDDHSKQMKANNNLNNLNPSLDLSTTMKVYMMIDKFSWGLQEAISKKNLSEINAYINNHNKTATTKLPHPLVTHHEGPIPTNVYALFPKETYYRFFEEASLKKLQDNNNWIKTANLKDYPSYVIQFITLSLKELNNHFDSFSKDSRPLICILLNKVKQALINYSDEKDYFFLVHTFDLMYSFTMLAMFPRITRFHPLIDQLTSCVENLKNLDEDLKEVLTQILDEKSGEKSFVLSEDTEGFDRTKHIAILKTKTPLIKTPEDDESQTQRLTCSPR